MTKTSALSWRFFRRMSGNRLFGRSLPPGAGLPVTIMNMMHQLYTKGPFTVGIFRKSANARLCREVAARLEADPDYSLDEVPIAVVGSVFKDFLRSLPNCLLDSRLLNKWIEAVSMEQEEDRRQAVHKLLKKITPENLLLLKHVLCLLWHIGQHSSVNKMCPSNLSVCIGPSLLSSCKIISPVRREEVSKSVPKVICYLIDHCADLFGESVLTLLGPELEPSRPDSGAEVSDSSCNSLSDSTTTTTTTKTPTKTTGAKTSCFNDVTSGDSDRRNKTSLSNLSRDSGLTASDTQLYSPADHDEEEDDMAPEEEKMFSLPAACSLPAVLFEQKKSTSPIFGLLKGRRNSKPALNNNTSLINNNDSHNNGSVPHLNTDELESMLNGGTFSYGKSIGTGINGSCQDVVRNRKRHQVISPQQVHPHHHHHHQQHSSSLSMTTRSPLVTLDNRMPFVHSVNNLYNNQLYNQHSNQETHPQQQQSHSSIRGVNRLFSKSVPHLNLIGGFRNSVTFSPSPRRATRVNLHAWSYDVSDAQRHNQSLPNDHYQPLVPTSDQCMYRCRATPFIPYGSQVNNGSSPHHSLSATCYARSNGGPIAGHNNVVIVNGKRLPHVMSPSTPLSAAVKSPYSQFGTACPPSYQETMDRKKFAARLQSNVSLFRKISFDGAYEQFELRL